MILPKFVGRFKMLSSTIYPPPFYFLIKKFISQRASGFEIDCAGGGVVD